MPLLCLKTRSDLIYLRKSYRQLFIKKKKKFNNENIYFKITSYKKHNIIINISNDELVSKMIFDFDFDFIKYNHLNHSNNLFFFDLIKIIYTIKRTLLQYLNIWKY